MAQLPREMADEVGKSRVGGGGNYIRHGTYPALMVLTWQYKKVQDRCIILETLVGESHKKVVYEGQKAVEEEPNAVGSTCSDVANFDGDGKLSAPANSRAPVLGLFGFKENDVPDKTVSDTLSYVCDDPTPAKGMILACDTFAKEIRSNKGNYITGRNWSCVSKPGEGVNRKELVAERLAAYAISPEECVKVIQRHLSEHRAANGQAPVASTTATTPPAVTTQAAVAAAGGAPQLPTQSAPQLPAGGPPQLPVADTRPWYVKEGWQVHPGDSKYFWKDTDIKLETELQSMRR